MKSACLVTALFLLAALTGYSQNVVELEWSYDVGTPLAILSHSGTNLAGNAAFNGGTGFVLQLGYYTNGNAGNPFGNGVWNAVFGPGTSNSLFSEAGMGTSFFDGSYGTVGSTGTDDSFSYEADVSSSVPSTEVGIPAAGQVMSIRYYNANSLGAATYFGAASDPNWLWVSPGAAANPMTFDMYEDPTIEYQGGASAPQTNMAYAIPEPPSLLSIAGVVAIGSMALLRRKTRPA